MRGTRLLTLTGPVGVGKTRLALDIADREHRSGRYEVASVDLDGVSDPETALRRVASSTGVDGDGRHRAGDKEALLVLDNCEELLDSCGTVVRRSLARRPGLRVLATSREPLRLPGEAVYRLAGLSLPAAGPRIGLVDHLRSGAVQLFMDRARAVSPYYQLTKENASLIAEICARLDGLPLAIEMAALLVRVFPLEEINARLEDRLSLLSSGWRTASERHRSLRASLDWSYRLLTGDEQVLYRRLSALTDGFTAEAAAAVAADSILAPESVPELLAQLESKSVITAQTGRAGTGRFRFPESVRLHGHEQLLAEGEAHRAYSRSAVWLAELAKPLSLHAVIRPQTVRALAEERGNLSHVLARGAGSADDRLLLAGALALVEVSREPKEHHSVLVSEVLAGAGPDARHRDIALEGAAVLAGYREDLMEARRLAEQAASLARRRNSVSLSRVLLLLGTVRDLSGDQTGATMSYAQCLKVSRRDGDELMEAVCRNSIAWRLLEHGSADDAQHLVRMNLSLVRAQGSPGQLIASLHLAGALALEQNNTIAAERHFAESLRGDSMHPSQTAATMEGLAVTAVRNSRFERALRLFGVAETLGSSPLSVRRWWREQVTVARQVALRALPAARTEAALASGRALWNGSAATWPLGHDPDVPADSGPLSSREWHVVTLIQEGLTNRQIAEHLHLSVRTVETHVRNARSALGLRSRSHVAAWAAQNGPGTAAVGRSPGGTGRPQVAALVLPSGATTTGGPADPRGVVFCTYAA
ncbi:ATP-binding protein [Streptomyces fuscichromogenes]|uniref:HTH luxR-type domain-containing protein n=1 Tax=Streptomyces fuscichromogenes TaxID=1324013 RepID=A0A917XPI9_9ACTN|nr:LuxR C-terminal-related transcriptional regulator [Streptomyces fuscichromogenes]GGN45497.1 hypothetical protein GCM10011578_097510 [Streptomyces fuscichromogenes]